jgi:hypothetical protein
VQGRKPREEKEDKRQKKKKEEEEEEGDRSHTNKVLLCFFLFQLDGRGSCGALCATPLLSQP